MDAYFAAKARLFAELLPAERHRRAQCRCAGRRAAHRLCAGAAASTVLTYGRAAGADFVSSTARPDGAGQALDDRRARRDDATSVLPLLGGFQAPTRSRHWGSPSPRGTPPGLALEALEQLQGVPGRMERVATHPERRAGDRRLRAHARCAGDGAPGAAPALPRPAGRRFRLRRRPRPRQAAADGRDRRAARRSRHRHRRQSAQRGSARRSAAPSSPHARGRARSATAPPRSARRSTCSQPDDLLLIAGKGHETRPDRRRQDPALRRCRSGARGARRARGRRRVSPLWTSAEAESATGGRSSAPWQATGVSIDSRTLAPGDLFVALNGPQFRRP